MGKGNRVRTQNADERKAKKEAAIKKAAKEKLYQRITTIVASVLAIALVFGFVWAAFLGDFFGSRSVHKAVTMKTENYSVSAAQFNYLYMSTYMSYQGYASYLGFSTETPLEDQAYTANGIEGYTWQDYFIDETKTAVRELLVLCEAAKERGIELDEESKTTIDSSIESLKSAAEDQGVSFERFVEAYYGDYINEEDIRTCMEMQILAGKAAEALEADPTYTDEQLEEESSNNLSSYYYADYRALEIKADYATGATTEVITAAKAEALDTAKKILEASTDEAAFLKAVEEYYREVYNVVADDAEETADEADETAEDAEDTEKDTEDTTDTREKITESKLTEKVEATLKEANAYSTADDIGKWAFEQDADGKYIRAAGDTKLIEDATNGKYTVYVMVKPMYRNDYKTRDVRHILITVDSYDETNGLPEEEAKAKADEILAEYEAGEKTADAFGELAVEHSQDSSASVGGLYENVYKGQMVDEFEEWLFAAKEEGETGIVKTTYGYHIMYYVGESEKEKWAVDAEANLRSADYEIAYEKLTEKFAVTVDDNAFKKVKQAGT